ncbi:hypothetical protein B0T25DRAFT_583640 [Lasiosphaeria hispida]|uniref:Uncharacterized protein n=1 Tax=Lasiosphaeria hispida TaxID=260671 RepID=A0AAJ0HBF9_9PEZI|nr:hypothetical protein B0T25DRAFT_583640 [Lasiosphaeria hispida]
MQGPDPRARTDLQYPDWSSISNSSDPNTSHPDTSDSNSQDQDEEDKEEEEEQNDEDQEEEEQEDFTDSDDEDEDVIQILRMHHSIRTHKVDTIIRDGFPDSHFKRRDIYNARANIRRQQLAGYTTASALMVALDHGNINYIVK